MALGKLSLEAKRFVVMELAMWELPSTIQKALKEQFDIEVTLPAIIQYDGTRAHCPKKWKQLFDDTRTQFIEDTSAIPIANKAFRLRELNRMLEVQRRRPDAQRNPADVRATLEQAAKEAGNVYTNRQEHTGKDGKDLIPAKDVVIYLPDNNRPDVA